jgi:hypothetical protein
MSKFISALGALIAAVVGGGHPSIPPDHRPASPPVSTTTASGLVTMSAPLQPMPAGTVDLSLRPGAQELVARLGVFGLTPGSAHRIVLFQGRDGGRASAVFPDVTADAGGQLTQAVVGRPSDLPASLPTDPFFQIDQGPTRASDDGQSPEVGVAHARQPSAPGHLTLGVAGTLARGGGARLVYDPRARTLSVRVSATGLRPNSRHAAHVHSGSCRVQGPVVDPLPDLVAGPRGAATSQTTLRNVTSPPAAQGWYVNVHEGDMNQILVDGKPGLLFQPVLCGSTTSS